MKRILVPTFSRVAASLTCVFWLSTIYVYGAPQASYAAGNDSYQRYSVGAHYGNRNEFDRSRQYQIGTYPSPPIYASVYEHPYSKKYAQKGLYDYGDYSSSSYDYSLYGQNNYGQRGYYQGAERYHGRNAEGGGRALMDSNETNQYPVSTSYVLK